MGIRKFCFKFHSVGPSGPVGANIFLFFLYTLIHICINIIYINFFAKTFRYSTEPDKAKKKKKRSSLASLFDEEESGSQGTKEREQSRSGSGICGFHCGPVSCARRCCCFIGAVPAPASASSCDCGRKESGPRLVHLENQFFF